MDWNNNLRNIALTTLSNGMRVVVRTTDSLVAYAGVAVNVGSRDESANLEGLAHFVEHTLFKGTLLRDSYAISDCMESVGGELNAYTSKEETLIYTNYPAGYTARALELLSDIVTSSSFPSAELDKEREVVIEEIYSYLDSPADRVYDEFDELIYAHSDLSHNILGSPESVRGLGSRDCRRFLDRFYTPSNMVLYVSTPESAEKVVSEAERFFSAIDRPLAENTRVTPGPVVPFDVVRDNDGHQSHTIIGTRLFGRNDPRRFALFLFNNYLGGPCMNSLLNRELREKHGLVYTVDSTVSLLSDTGIMQIYFGTDAENVDKCRSLIFDTINRLASDKLSESRMEAIKEQYCGQLLVSTDHRESMAMSMGKSVLYYDEVHDPMQTAELIRMVSAEDLRMIAELCAPANCSRLTLR